MTPTKTSPAGHDDIVIRRAYPDDRTAVERLAGLDSASAPSGQMLLAEQGGELRAALDLEHGIVLADPFRPTLNLVSLLRLQAAAGTRRERPPAPGTDRARASGGITLARRARRALSLAGRRAARPLRARHAR